MSDQQTVILALYIRMYMQSNVRTRIWSVHILYTCMYIFILLVYIIVQM